MNIAEFKSHFYTGLEFITLNNSGQALIPDTNRDLAKHWLDRAAIEGPSCAMEAWGESEITRRRLAQFLGADPEELAFFTTVSAALSQVAWGLPLQKDDEILTWDQEYPSNFYPWRQAAAKAQAHLIQIESENHSTPVERILERVSKRTKAIAISWVQYQTGSVTDLQALSRELRDQDIWLIADVIQGAGVRPLNFRESGFDVLCGGSHKFMCSGYGASFMTIKKDRALSFEPLNMGAMTFGDPDTPKSFSIKPKTDASRFESGTKAILEIIAMQASLELFTKTGIEVIFAEASRLAQILSQGLRDLGFEVISNGGPILNFYSRNPADLERAAMKLTQNKVSFARRTPGLRLSTHAYNTDEQIHRVLDILS